ncbi:MAG: 16S rRNA (adenine(1518)-N(6)/adenine(1519)-N(6))-dimethyltransferase RsmA [Bryobacteraceae bacterium]
MPRKLGQHFLRRDDVLERIACAACPQNEPLVVEIGAGDGALTAHLARRCQRLIAIELDPALVTRLRQRFRDSPAVEIVGADVLKLDLSQWGPAVIAGNIPYYISSPILTQVLELGTRMKRAVLLVQREVAARLAAQPGRRDYGLLSVHAQLVSEPEILFGVPPSAFSPPPEVSSALIRLVPRARPLLPWERIPAFLDFAARCFRYKRRTLRNNLAGQYPRELLEGRPEMCLRAEQLSLAELVALFEALHPRA